MVYGIFPGVRKPAAGVAFQDWRRELKIESSGHREEFSQNS